jgi:hypothetical protein
MRYLNDRTESEIVIISDAYGKKMDISANPIQIVPFPQGPKQNPGMIQFKDNTLNNVCNNPQDSYYKKCYVYDQNDINLQYDHTGKYVASASSVYKNDDNYNAYHAFNNTGENWRSSPTANNNAATQEINLFKISDKDGIKSKDKYGRPHYGQSFLNGGAPKTTVKYGALNNGSASKANLTGSSVDIYGEWLQIETPSPFYLYRYSIRVPNPNANFVDGGDYSGKRYPLDKRATMDYINGETFLNMREGLVSEADKLCFNNKQSDKAGCNFNSVINQGKNSLNGIASENLKPDRALATPKDNWTSHFPKVFTVVGSIDGKDWYYIDQQSFIDPPDLPKTIQDGYESSTLSGYIKGYGYKKNPGLNKVTFEVNSIDKYSCYRLIVSEMFPNNSYVQITTWTLDAFVDNFTPNKESKKEASYEPFSNFLENSPQYVTGMTNWDYFSKGIDSNLLNKYKEQKELVSQAKKSKDALPELESFTGNQLINQFSVPISTNYGTYITTQQRINNNYYEMGNSITSFNRLYGNLTTDPKDPYDFGGNGFSRAPTIVDGWINDNKEIIMQQNSIYILSTITIASLVLALILVSK